MKDPDFATRLRQVLTDRVPALGVSSVQSVRRLPGGLSFETYIVDAETRTGQKRFILRREPTGGPLEPYDVCFEANMFRALADSDVPVPGVFHVEVDHDVLDRPFIVSEFMQGAGRVHTQAQYDDPATRERTLDTFVDTLARIHSVPTAGLPTGPGGASTGTRDEVRLWRKRFTSVELSPRPIIRFVFDVLEEYAPEAHPMVLVHGDYRLSNLLWDEQDAVTTVLDWERSFIGDPMADIAFTRNKALAGWCTIDGKAAERYTALTGFDIDPTRLRFWQLFELVKAAYVGMACAASLVRGTSSDLRLLSVANASTAIEPALLRLVNALTNTRTERS
ncbi:phosphotransferase family protein [Rhodococcus erythropolis]|uniref:phosphotransferase family protein n=1 Tax=Rhodococcus erythropolis TaxID=1833 RepID=UPI0024B84DD2|nr:phosphotransferase family protein [Rhodococcus erythropolis]MDJ0015514.1 phosphotransferase family protein [Rhodococcus erythropolis]